MTVQEERMRLVTRIARVLEEAAMPDDVRQAALTLIGWLARRMPGEAVSRCEEMTGTRPDAPDRKSTGRMRFG